MKRFAFTWNAPPSIAASRGKRTVVVLDFTPAGRGATRLRFTQLGWGEGPDWFPVAAVALLPVYLGLLVASGGAMVLRYRRTDDPVVRVRHAHQYREVVISPVEWAALLQALPAQRRPIE